MPHENNSTPPAYLVDSGATPAYPVCDCHIHFYDASYPVSSGTTLIHPTITLADYVAVRRINGASRYVVVQPSAYGFDNRVLINALIASRGAARGVAVVSPDVSDDELASIRHYGVTGLRVNLTLGPLTMADAPRLAQRAQDFGMHLQFNLVGAQLLDYAEAMSALPVPVVIDHCGYLCRDPVIASRVFECLLWLLMRSEAWLKLSAPYVASRQERSAYADLTPFLAELLQRCPDRLLYGSDWPHVTEAEQVDEHRLFEIQRAWLGGPDTTRMILSSNAARLYGFDEDAAANSHK